MVGRGHQDSRCRGSARKIIKLAQNAHMIAKPDQA
jgi:hypothetical protein